MLSLNIFSNDKRVPLPIKWGRENKRGIKTPNGFSLYNNSAHLYTGLSPD